MTDQINSKIGLIAGAGEIPVYFVKKAQEKGISIVSIGLTEDIHKDLKPYVDSSYYINMAKGGKIVKTFANENVKNLIIMGKVEKKMIFKPQMFDLETLKAFMAVKSNQDKTVMMHIIDEIEKRGFKVLDQMDFMKELYPEKGILTKKTPTDKQMKDIEYGLPIAKYMADQEIGQTIVVKNKSVIAVEAVEGTDLTIERGCQFSKGKCTIIKVSRTNQDYRFDSPGIGPKTIQGLINGRASVLAIEAGRVMIINREEVLKVANRAGLSIISV